MGDEEQTDHEKAAQEMREFEQRDELPSDLSEWPDGKAKFVTYGEDEDGAYGEGLTEKLGPAEVGRHEDGSVTISGEKVDDPDAHKSDPIKSGVVEQIEDSKEKYKEILDEHPQLRDGDKRKTSGGGDEG